VLSGSRSVYDANVYFRPAGIGNTAFRWPPPAEHCCCYRTIHTRTHAVRQRLLLLLMAHCHWDTTRRRRRCRRRRLPSPVLYNANTHTHTLVAAAVALTSETRVLPVVVNNNIIWTRARRTPNNNILSTVWYRSQINGCRYWYRSGAISSCYARSIGSDFIVFFKLDN